MMDREALEFLAEQFAQGYISDDEGCAIALPSGVTLHDLEPYQLGRRRFRGLFATHSFASFCEYVTHRGEQYPVYIDAKKMQAKAFFNLGTVIEPDHGDDCATLQLEQAAAFKALLEFATGRQFSQQSFAEWLEDWAPQIEFVTETGETQAKASAVMAIRSIKVDAKRAEEHEVGNQRASRSAMEEIEARSKHTLPAGFVFKCIPYESLRERAIDVRIGVILGGEKPALTARIVGLGALVEDMATEFQQNIRKTLKDSNTLLGTFAVGK